jgi:hypothetical protein
MPRACIFAIGLVRRQGQEHYHKELLRQLRRLGSSARETLLPCHYDIELDMVDIALWIEA